MKALIQRVSEAKVTVDKKVVGQIGRGVVILLGVRQTDTEKDADFLVGKIVNLRIFPGEKGHFDVALTDVKGEALVVSQFTLYGSCDKGRRPDFIEAAKPDHAEKLYDYFVKKMKETGIKTKTGVFQAMMDVHLINDGPVTFMLES